jgi:pimeloyl-ACP methyl ester carboxylesterase
MCPRSRRTWLSGDRAVAVWIPPDSLPADASAEAEADTWADLLDALHIPRLPVIAVSAGAAPAVQLALRHPPACRTWCCWFQAPAACIRAGPVLLHASRWRRCVFELTMWLLMRLAPRFMYRLVGIPSSLIPSLTLEQRAALDEVVD